MLGNKLTKTIGKVTAFIDELKVGIELNDTKEENIGYEIDKLESEAESIAAETAVAKKLLEKLQ